MTEIKRQHFLPFVFLKYFRCDPDVATREKATILRDDGNSVVEEKVANQCYSSWCYRRTDTHQSESSFGTFERDWDEVIQRARLGRHEHALLFSQMVLYHFRNLSIKLLTDRFDRFTAVEGSIFSFIEQKILRLPAGVRFTDDPTHVTAFPWRTKLVSFPKDVLLVSDNPSVMTILTRQREEYGPFFLPISPRELLVAIDPCRYRFKDSSIPTLNDSFLANAYVAAQGMRHVYYSAPMDATLRKNLWQFIGRNRIGVNVRGSIDGKRFVPCHPIYPSVQGQHFSFLDQLDESGTPTTHSRRRA